MLAVGLTLLATLTVLSLPHFIPMRGGGPPDAILRRAAHPPVWTTYALIAATFLPLALRRRFPLTVLGIVVVAASFYDRLPNPPTFALIGPLIALYTVGTLYSRRTLWIAATVAAVSAGAISVRSLEGLGWISDLVPTLALFAVAASLGDSTRNRRAYVHEVEQRALDAERTRDEVARRRVEEERLRIARELHDVTAHSLSIIAVQAGAAEEGGGRHPVRARLAPGRQRPPAQDALAGTAG
ncbi:MAG: hypothetical protein FDZ75_03135, partial [Actinobacteria bacterium]